MTRIPSIDAENLDLKLSRIQVDSNGTLETQLPTFCVNRDGGLLHDVEEILQRQCMHWERRYFENGAE